MAIGWERIKPKSDTSLCQTVETNKKTYLWDIFIAHDGDPHREFWGCVEKLTLHPANNHNHSTHGLST